MTREEAIRLIKSCGFNVNGIAEKELEQVVLEALQERPKGQWIKKRAYITTDFGRMPVLECSNCTEFIVNGGHSNFCPNCGSDNRESEE